MRVSLGTKQPRGCRTAKSGHTVNITYRIKK